MVKLRLGNRGAGRLACLILMTGLTTAIACLASVSEYFSRIFPTLSYKAWVIALGLLSLVITNFGLTTILRLASPVLLFLYPIAISLIALVFLNKWFGGRRAVYVGTVIGAGFIGVLDGLKDVNLLPAAVVELQSQYLPLYASGMGWISLAVLGGVLGLAYAKLGGQGGTAFKNVPVA